MGIRFHMRHSRALMSDTAFTAYPGSTDDWPSHASAHRPRVPCTHIPYTGRVRALCLYLSGVASISISSFPLYLSYSVCISNINPLCLNTCSCSTQSALVSPASLTHHPPHHLGPSWKQT